MTGIVAVFLASRGGGLNPAFGPNLTNTSVVSGIRVVSLSLAADGTATATGAAGSNWALPAFAGVGSAWSVRFSHSGPNLALNSGVEATWLSLAAGSSISLKNSIATVEAIGTLTVEFSRDGGASVVATYNLSVDVGYTP